MRSAITPIVLVPTDVLLESALCAFHFVHAHMNVTRDAVIFSELLSAVYKQTPLPFCSFIKRNT